ncbi:MAG: FHA domain-containing protein [Oligoflexia bacterium]|nr:FHA domain-containing protein [Oligoflexia bacterium]
MMKSKFRVTLKFSGMINGPFILEKEKTIIGRGSKSDIVIINDSLSRQHLLLEIIEGKLYLTDLGSSNGTKIADQQIPTNEKTLYDTFFMPIEIGIGVNLIVEEGFF